MLHLRLAMDLILINNSQVTACLPTDTKDNKHALCPSRVTMLYLLFVIAMSKTNCANASLGKTGKDNKVTNKHSHKTEVNLNRSHREVKVTLKFAISMEVYSVTTPQTSVFAELQCDNIRS